jgi:hypothetical protein
MFHATKPDDLPRIPLANGQVGVVPRDWGGLSIPARESWPTSILMS